MVFMKARSILSIFGPIQRHSGGGLTESPNVTYSNRRFLADGKSTSRQSGELDSAKSTAADAGGERGDKLQKVKTEYWDRYIREAIRSNSHL